MSWGSGAWGGPVDSGGSAPVGDPPTIGNFAPTAGHAISPDQAIQFDVTDPDDNIRRVIVAVTQADTGVTEVVHDGAAFRGRFTTLSSRFAITNGYRYAVRRAGGWTGSPSFDVWAIDTAGLENA